MAKRTIVVTEVNGKYQVQSDGTSEFELLGILECIVFDIKSARHAETSVENRVENKVEDKVGNKEEQPAIQNEIVQESNRAAAESTASPDLRTRINNAVKAIGSLGGEITDTDRSNATDEELQAELDDLTIQYKRLKSSKQAK
jgi:hypothetical protein